MTIWGSFVRYIGLFLSAIPFGLGFFWVGIDDRRQAWHDKLVHTCVVYAWRRRAERILPGPAAPHIAAAGDRPPVSGPKLPVIHKNYDLVTIAFPEYERLEKILDLVQDAIADKQVHIVNATVLVKGGDGAISVLGATDLATNRPRRFVEDGRQYPRIRADPHHGRHPQRQLCGGDCVGGAVGRSVDENGGSQWACADPPL